MTILEMAVWKIKGANGAAELLGISPGTLTARIRKRGLKRTTRPRERWPELGACGCTLQEESSRCGRYTRNSRRTADAKRGTASLSPEDSAQIRLMKKSFHCLDGADSRSAGASSRLNSATSVLKVVAMACGLPRVAGPGLVKRV